MGLNRAKSPVSSVNENSMALSRTVRLTQFSATMPPSTVFSDPKFILKRDGFRPNTPQHEDGIRMEPPPSEACAAGRIIGIPGVVAGSQTNALGRRQQPEFRGVRLADDDKSRVDGLLRHRIADGRRVGA